MEVGSFTSGVDVTLRIVLLTPKAHRRWHRSLLVCSKKEEVDSGDSLSQVTGQNTRKRNTKVLTVRPRLKSLDLPKVVEQIDLIFC